MTGVLNLNLIHLIISSKKNDIRLEEKFISIKEMEDYSFELTLKSIPPKFDIVFGLDYGECKANIDDLYSAIKSKYDGLWMIKTNNDTLCLMVRGFLKY